MDRGPRAAAPAPLTRRCGSSCHSFRKTRARPAPGSALPKFIAVLHPSDIQRAMLWLGPLSFGPRPSGPWSPDRYACSPPHGPRTTAHGPLLQRRETRLTDGFPVTRFMLFEQAVAQLLKRERIKRKTIEHRRLQHSKATA